MSCHQEFGVTAWQSKERSKKFPHGTHRPMDGSLNVVGSDATTPRHLDAAESGRLERSHSQGHSRPKQAIHGVSALPPLATELRTTPEVRFVPSADISTCNAWETEGQTRSNTPGKSP
jgi:hypothetical protein